MRIEIINTKALQLVLALVGMLAFASAAAAPKDFELHQAVLDNNLQLVGKFLSKGANIDLIGSRKYGYGSALHLAVREGHLDIAQLLLERGAQVDVLDPDDFTPLHNAAWNGNLEMTQLLLDAGADIEASTYDGDTPLTLAQNNDQARVAEFIQAKLEPSPTSGAKVDTPTSSDPGVIDISGTYVADITGPITKLIKDRSPANQIVKIERSGDIFIGSFDDGRGKLYVEIEGDEFKFDWHGWSAGGKGTWSLKPGSKDLVGTWYKTGGTVGHSGKWNLTRIEDKAESAASADAPAVDISGTYTSTLTYPSYLARHNYRWYLGKESGLEVTIEQKENTITGSFTGNGKGRFKGTIKGNEVTVDLDVEPYGGSPKHGNATWIIADDHGKLTGKWLLDGTTGKFEGEWNLTRIETKATATPASETEVADISGTYNITELVYPGNVNKGYYRWYFGKGKDLKMTIKQDGEVVSGVFSGEVTGEFKGAVKGNEITFDYDSVAAGSSRFGSGVLMVSEDSTELVGTFFMKGVSSGSFTGQWKFRKAESEMPRSLTGTYRAKVTAEKGLIRSLLSKRTIDSESEFYKFIDRGDESELTFNMSLVQNGSQISAKMLTGRLGSKTPEPFGVVFGEFDGGTIEFEWDANMYGKGTWTIGTGNNDMTGTFFHTSGGSMFGSGKWDLTRIE